MDSFQQSRLTRETTRTRTSLRTGSEQRRRRGLRSSAQRTLEFRRRVGEAARGEEAAEASFDLVFGTNFGTN